MEEKTMSIDEAVAAIGKMKASESLTIVLDENTMQITSELREALAHAKECCKVNLDLSKTKITEIKEQAFFACRSLASVTMPDSVTTIGYGAFIGCISLASVIIPDSVASIENDAFSGCTSLASVIISDSVTGIRNDAFEYNVTVTYKGKTYAWWNIYRQFFAK